jgi:hypothetical protein
MPAWKMESASSSLFRARAPRPYTGKDLNYRGKREVKNRWEFGTKWRAVKRSALESGNEVFKREGWKKGGRSVERRKH